MIPLERILNEKISYRGSYIGKRWTLPEKPSAQFEVVSPANLEWVLPPVKVSYDHVEGILHEASLAFKSWRQESLQSRIARVRRFGDELSARAETIARLVAIETGKPFDEALSEAKLLGAKVAVTVDEALRLVETQQLDLGSAVGEIHYRPHGVLLIIGPFNFPVHLSNGHIIPALLMGNVCILKPSEKAPYSAQLYMEAAEAADLPAGVLQLIQGGGEVASRLQRDPRCHGVIATCSYEVGAKIQKDLAANPEKIVALEMGGKNAALVHKDVDVDRCVQDLLQSSFLTTGQRCTALSRVYVERPLLDKLVAKFHEQAKQLVISHPFDTDPKPFMGPLISAASKDNFLRYTGIAESEKAQVLMRPKALEGKSRLSRRPIPEGHYVTPGIHVVEKWSAKSTYQSHEIFGPDIFFAPVDNAEEGVEAINASEYGLVCSIFGGDVHRFQELASQIDCGLLYHNRATIGASARLPFGGWKKSGNHRPAGIFSIYASTHVQARLFSP